MISQPSSTPTISVIVPVFNTARFLEKCLASILSQTFGDFEILLIDDGSTDDSVAVAERTTAGDPRLKVVSQPNSGLAFARNVGVERARGEFVAFVDSDDYLAESMFETMVEKLRADNSDICICQFNQVDESGEVLATSAFPSGLSVDDYFRLVLSSQESSMACNKLIRRTLFDVERTRFPVGLIHEDVPTICKLFRYAQSVSVLDEAFYMWVRREGTLSKSISFKHALDLMWGFELTRADLERWGVLEAYRPELFRRIAHFSVGVIGRLRTSGGAVREPDAIHLIRHWILLIGFGSDEDLDALRVQDADLHKRYVRLFTGPAADSEEAAPSKHEYALLEARLDKTAKRLEMIETSTSFRGLVKVTSAIGKLFPLGSRRRAFLRAAAKLLVRR